MACNIQKAIDYITNKNGVVDKEEILINLESAIAVGKELRRLTAAKPVDSVGIKAEVDALRKDIEALEFEQSTVDFNERAEYTTEISKLEAKATKLLDKLAIKDTIGDRLRTGQHVDRDKTRSKLSDFFKPKMRLTNISLFGDLFEGSFDKVKETINVKPGETTYFDGAKERMLDAKNAVKDFVAVGMDQTRIKNIDVDPHANSSELFQSISRLLLIGNPGKYRLPEDVVTVIAAISLDMLANAEYKRAAVRGPEDVNKLLGRSADTVVTDEEYNRVKDIDFFSNTLANSMGASIYKELGLTANKEWFAEAELLEDKMKTELGLFALGALEHAGAISINKKTPAEIYGKDSLNNKIESINVVQFTGANEFYGKGSTLSADSRFVNKVLGTESRRVTPELQAPNEHVVKNKSAMGKFFEVAEKSAKALLKAEAVPWQFNADVMDDYMQSVSTEEGRQAIMEILGYVAPESVHVSRLLSVNGKNAAIELQMKNLEDWHAEMKDAGKTAMWFKYFFGKNGRFYLDSNVVNPQNNKLHRFAVTTGRETLSTEHEVNMYKLGLGQAFGLDIDKHTIASTLKQFEDIEKSLSDIAGMTTIEIMNAINNEGLLQVNGKAVHPHDAEHAMAGIVEYKRYVAHIAKGSSAIGFDAGLSLETDAVTSGYILKSLQMPLLSGSETEAGMEEHLEGGGVFVGNRVESITEADVKELEESGGVFVKDSKGTGGVSFTVKSFGTKAEDKSKPDAYQRPASVMTKTIPKTLADLKAGTTSDAKGTFADGSLDRITEFALGGEIGSSDKLPAISRSFMKSPFMVFNYGSGLGSIVNSLADTTIENLYKMFEHNNNQDQVFAVLEAAGTGAEFNTETNQWAIKEYNKVDVEAARAFAEVYKNSTPGERLTLTIPANLEQNIKDITSASVGAALASTFNTVYAPYIEAATTINKSFSTMFKLFKVRLDKDIKAEETYKGRRLTTAEEDDVVRSLAKSMPAIDTALTDGNDKSKLLIYDEAKSEYVQAGEGLSITGQAKVRLMADRAIMDSYEADVASLQLEISKTSGIERDTLITELNSLKKPVLKEKALSGQVSKYELVAAMAAGAVIPIHYIDGSAMAETMLETKSLGIHDAKLGTPKDILEDSTVYNKAIGDIANGYSLTTAVLSSFNETLNEATQEELDIVTAELSNGKEDGPTVESTYDDMVSLHNRAEQGRSEIYSKPIRYEHMALEGSHYDWNMEGNKYTKQEPKVSRSAEVKTAGIRKRPTVGSRAESVNVYQHPVETKGSSAIMPDIKSEFIDTKSIAREVSIIDNKITNNKDDISCGKKGN